MARKKSVDMGVVDTTEQKRLNETRELHARTVRQQVGGE